MKRILSNQPKKRVAPPSRQSTARTKKFSAQTSEERRKTLRSSAKKFNKDFGKAIKQLANE